MFGFSHDIALLINTFFMKMCLCKVEENKGTKMSLGEVYYRNLIFEISFFNIMDASCKESVVQGLGLKLFTPWECVNGSQSTGKTFTTGRTSEGHFWLPAVLGCICMCLFTLRQQWFQDQISIVAEIKKYLLSWMNFVFLRRVYLKCLDI